MYDLNFFKAELKPSKVNRSSVDVLTDCLPREQTWFSCPCIFKLMFESLFVFLGTTQQGPWWHGGHLRTVGHIGWLRRPPGARLTLLHALCFISVHWFGSAVHIWVLRKAMLWSMDLWQKCCAAWAWTRTVCLYLRLYGIKSIYLWSRVKRRGLTILESKFSNFCSPALVTDVVKKKNVQYKALTWHWTQQVVTSVCTSWVKKSPNVYKVGLIPHLIPQLSGLITRPPMFSIL